MYTIYKTFDAVDFFFFNFEGFLKLELADIVGNLC